MGVRTMNTTIYAVQVILPVVLPVGGYLLARWIKGRWEQQHKGTDGKPVPGTEGKPVAMHD